MARYSIGHGTRVAIGRQLTANSSFTYTYLAGVNDVDLPNSTRDEVEVTDQDSNGQKEFIAGLTDRGEVTFADMNWKPGSTTDTLLSTINRTGEDVVLRFEIVNSDVTESYRAFCKSYDRSAPNASKMSATATFRVSAEVTED